MADDTVILDSGDLARYYTRPVHHLYDDLMLSSGLSSSPLNTVERQIASPLAAPTRYVNSLYPSISGFSPELDYIPLDPDNSKHPSTSIPLRTQESNQDTRSNTESQRSGPSRMALPGSYPESSTAVTTRARYGMTEPGEEIREALRDTYEEGLRWIREAGARPLSFCAPRKRDASHPPVLNVNAVKEVDVQCSTPRADPCRPARTVVSAGGYHGQAVASSLEAIARDVKDMLAAFAVFASCLRMGVFLTLGVMLCVIAAYMVSWTSKETPSSPLHSINGSTITLHYEPMGTTTPNFPSTPVPALLLATCPLPTLSSSSESSVTPTPAAYGPSNISTLPYLHPFMQNNNLNPDILHSLTARFRTIIAGNTPQFFHELGSSDFEQRTSEAEGVARDYACLHGLLHQCFLVEKPSSRRPHCTASTTSYDCLGEKDISRLVTAIPAQLGVFTSLLSAVERVFNADVAAIKFDLARLRANAASSSAARRLWRGAAWLVLGWGGHAVQSKAAAAAAAADVLDSTLRAVESGEGWIKEAAARVSAVKEAVESLGEEFEKLRW